MRALATHLKRAFRCCLSSRLLFILMVTIRINRHSPDSRAVRRDLHCRAAATKPTFSGFRVVARPGSSLWASWATANRAPHGESAVEMSNGVQSGPRIGMHLFHAYPHGSASPAAAYRRQSARSARRWSGVDTARRISGSLTRSYSSSGSSSVSIAVMLTM